MQRFFLILVILFIPTLLQAQITGWVEDFNDNILTGWQADQTTFQLTEQDSVLKINYTRTAASYEWHNFNYTPPQPILVVGNPYISVRVKSNVNTELTFKPIYYNEENDWLQEYIYGDNSWHEVVFRLENHGGTTLQIIYMYLDGGSTIPKSGTVLFDDLKIGNAVLILNITNLQAETIDSSRIDLSWQCNNPQLVQYYNIYRSNLGGFTCNATTFLDTTSQRIYSDLGLEANQTYYYKVTAIDINGSESGTSNETSARTYRSGVPPRISVQSTNSNTVALYEKFEAILLLQDAAYINPYNPEEIDVRAIFNSPTGKTWEIFGFYDNYNNRDQWKIRFSPNEIGTWCYTVYATDLDGSGQSEEYSFEAVASPHHGWLKISPVNPHYFMLDDGASFYGVGPYYPWGVNNGSTGLANLEASGANMFGYWNIMYGGEGNIIESMESGLGRYDQPKCGRIDQILEWSEARNLKMMLAIWPHDLLSHTVWAHQWHRNPYNLVCNVTEFFESEAAWEYQRKQYRYLIARWGHSRSLGIWEIVNEINGTDGWQAGKQTQALAWVQRVHNYLKQNDPYGRPTTASMSGGHYWREGYTAVDLPNVHVYETSWTAHYPGNPLRSSLWLYGNIPRQFWQDFNKPGIMGEAGYYDTYGSFAVPSDEYTALFHNALWASWAGGLAATPFWWDFGTKQIMSNQVMAQMLAFSKIANVIDYAHIPLNHAQITVPGCDAYAMEGDTMAFGWVRESYGSDVSAKSISLEGLIDAAFSVVWLNPWQGDTIQTHTRFSQNGQLNDQIPVLSHAMPDIAFLIQTAKDGETPDRLELIAYPSILFNDTTHTAQVSCYIQDNQGRICSQANNPITFMLEGCGRLQGNNPAIPNNGLATITFKASVQPGEAKIIASSAGLQPDTIEVQVKNLLTIDDFEDYASNSILTLIWQARYGTNAEFFLESSQVGQGEKSLRTEYSIGNGSPPYAGIFRNLAGNFNSANFLRFWLKPDNSGRSLAILLYETSGKYWQYDYILNGSDSMTITIPLSNFKASDGSIVMDRTALNRISLNVLKGSATWGSGTLYFDEIEFLTKYEVPVIESKNNRLVPKTFNLDQNYPNPFNHETVIQYTLPQKSSVRITMYNLQGQVIEILVDEIKEAGIYQIRWNSRNVGSGVYFYRMEAGNFEITRKCLLLR